MPNPHKRGKIVYIDVDDTVAATRGAIVSYYRAKTGDCSTTTLMYDGPMYNVLCPLWDRQRISDSFIDPEFFNYLKPIGGARSAIKYLLREGYDVRFCTAHREEGRQYKEAWIRHYFPMVEKIVFTEVMVPKDAYVGYAFIDDHMHNLENNKSEVKVLFDNYNLLDYNNNKVTKINNWGRIEEVL